MTISESNPTCSNPCEGAYAYNEGLKGTDADITKLLLVMHRSDSRALRPSLFDDYQIALMESQTGKTLAQILRFSNLSWEDIYLTNVFKCILPNRDPSREEYRKCAEVLEEQVLEFNPTKLVCFGHIAYPVMFSDFYGFGEAVGQTHHYNGISTLVSYHPGKLWRFPPEQRTKHYENIADFLSR